MTNTIFSKLRSLKNEFTPKQKKTIMMITVTCVIACITIPTVSVLLGGRKSNDVSISSSNQQIDDVSDTENLINFDKDSTPTQQPSIEKNSNSKQPSLRTKPNTVMPSSSPSIQKAKEIPFSSSTNEPSNTIVQNLLSSSPSHRPSYSQSNAQTFLPTSSPTHFPTHNPSATPSQIPSVQPTNAPSPSPSTQPSMIPSPTPTQSPSSLPSTVPTTQPSLEPTKNPTDRPTVSPVSQDYCFTNLIPPDELRLTSGKWWEYASQLNKSRHEWFAGRGKDEPISGLDTMISAVLFTLSSNGLKLTAFFPPLYPGETRDAKLVVTGTVSGKEHKTSCDIKEDFWYCPFRIEGINTDESYTYSVKYTPNKNSDPETTKIRYSYNGNIPKPVDLPRIASVGCFGIDNTMDKTELVNAVEATNPDLLILSGDQTYSHRELVYGFQETLHSIQHLTRNIPTIVMMDDHDYGQGNLMGADTGDEESGSGFEKATCLINSIEDLMVSHNPDPARDTVMWNGMSSKYTSYIYGDIDFAITEARKFKQTLDTKKDNSLLGNEQEEWLKSWCETDIDKIKVVLAATPFASLPTHSTSFSSSNSIKAVSTNNIDPNGFPVKGRTRVMEILNGCSSLILSGDQHLGIAVTYDDYNVSDCASPAAINSVFWRLNYNNLNETHTDAFGNKYTLHNAWNIEESVLSNHKEPSKTRNQNKTVKNDRGDGFMTIRFDGSNAVCAMNEYWLGH
eukprot:CAMPEP_0184870946 /NCGR_PEP_ID=MMETSP0580-20130426/39326_1 /TAXON_ID=1118495 /ORGANISM="Dactyliosolen fragilissimus" /LENGTH=731 /DNA_ID=CAMNT_0027373343 /DNA_START=60 /DNA_END=2252 /DNA_ORIENTATION=+